MADSCTAANKEVIEVVEEVREEVVEEVVEVMEEVREEVVEEAMEGIGEVVQV